MRNPIDLFSAAWTLVTGHLKLFALISLLAVLIISGMTAVLGIDPLGPGSENLPTTPEFAFILVSVVVGMLANIAIVKAVAHPESDDLVALFRFSVHLLVPYLWVSILAGIAIMLGFIALIIPGIFLAVSLSLVNYVVVLEDVRGVAALKKSYGYVKGRWFGVFGRYLFLILLGILFSMLLGLVSAATFISPYLASFAVGFVSMLGTAISVAYVYGMYTDIRSSAPTAPAMPVPEAPHETPQG